MIEKRQSVSQFSFSNWEIKECDVTRCNMNLSCHDNLKLNKQVSFQDSSDDFKIALRKNVELEWKSLTRKSFCLANGKGT